MGRRLNTCVLNVCIKGGGMGLEGEGSTKERLFVAAVKVFAESGYRGGTVREICRGAGAANVNAVNYYFGGKKKLYALILQMMFSELGKRFGEKMAEMEGASARERLGWFIRVYCALLYSGVPLAAEMVAIFNREMLSPSCLLDEIAENVLVPQTTVFIGLLRECLGPDVPEERVRFCLASVVGQMIYFSSAGPVFFRVFPEHPSLEEVHEAFAEHVERFTFAGLDALIREFAAEAAADGK